MRALELIRQVNESGVPAAEAWDRLFQSADCSSELLMEVVLTLHDQKNYEQAVECLSSSLRNDHGQAWTYDILAMEMKLAGRPAAELNRVLQSRVDFAAGNVQQMLIAAAMLSRFEAHPEALQICRQATSSAPEAPEPWLLGRSIADKTGSPADRVAFRCGILRHVWTEDYAALHAEARTVVKEILKELERSGKLAEASAARERLDEASAIDLRIQLKWTGSADLDLSVDEPGGERCTYRNRLTKNGGRLIHEDGGSGSGKSGSRIEEYVIHTAPAGEYTAVIRFVFGKVTTGNVVVDVIRHQNTPSEKRTRQTVSLGPQDTRLPITLESGRRP